MSRIEDTERDAERKPDHDADLLEQARERAREALRDMKEQLGKAKEHLGDAAGAVRGHLGDAAGAVKENAGEIARNVQEHGREFIVGVPLVAGSELASFTGSAMPPGALEQHLAPPAQVEQRIKLPAHLETLEQRQARTAEQAQLERLKEQLPDAVDEFRETLERNEKQAEAIARPKPIEVPHVDDKSKR